MPSPDRLCKHPAWLIFGQEIRSLLLSPALWIMFIITSLLAGYSFIQAVSLYAQASRTALNFPQLAAGMNPLDGILVPTFGAFYLTQTLLLPFIAIRVIGQDKQNGALKLLLQLPLSSSSLCSLKLAAMLVVWFVSLLPAGLALFFWHTYGGFLYWPETLVLFSGHALYALTVIAIAMFAATITNALPTAAMLCLSVTLGSWVLDFTLAGQGGFSSLLKYISLAGMLHHFETGLLSSQAVIVFLGIAGLFFSLTFIWIHPGQQTRARLLHSMFSLGFVAVLAGIGANFPLYLDATENNRHSLNTADVLALKQLSHPLTLTVHLDPQDSRLLDLQQDLLAKLQRTVPQLRFRYAHTANAADGMFSVDDDQYGLIEYEYNGGHDQSYSNSREEILPIIYRLADLQVTPVPEPVYRGHPLVADAAPSGWWFYGALPFLFLSAGIYARKGKW